MQNSFIALLLAFVALPVAAADAPPSRESLYKLLEVTQSRKLLDSSMNQIDGIMERSMKREGQPLEPEAQEIIRRLRARVVDLMKEEMTWETLEPQFIDIYSKSFTQKEVDGMLAFYATDVGKSMITKMPIVMQHSLELVQARMVKIMPRVQEAQREAIAELEKLEKP